MIQLYTKFNGMKVKINYQGNFSSIQSLLHAPIVHLQRTEQMNRVFH